ncbi:MAG: DNA mismatch repair endonuclease MutL [Chitinophagaceae bacterium]|nr:DNA mismatch repair endonuclease MutL [Oligoflexus sp.]
MARVHLLDDELINKIAAGEVVERPASVVKELVENAIDAGSTTIRVSLKDGGRTLIEISDDGLGMIPEDAVLALKRHTTSKLRNADDLFEVATMGFRGEALASISSVSRFTLQTMSRDSVEGIRVHHEDGVTTRSPWQGSFGTSVTIKDIFYNVPARKTFMKTAAAEFAVCHEYLQALALAHPQLGFRLLHNDKEIFSVSPLPIPDGWAKGEQALRLRTQAILGEELVSQLVYLQHQDRHVRLEGLISPPGVDKGTAKHIFTFVNSRWVKDKVLRYGILRGYHSHILRGKFPVVLLHADIEASLVDVNVHPAKTELRFQYGTEVQASIAMAIRDGLRQGAWGSSKPNPSISASTSYAPKPPALSSPSSAPTAPAYAQAKAPDDFDLLLSKDKKDSIADFAAIALREASTPSPSLDLGASSTDRSSGIKRTTMPFDGPVQATPVYPHYPKPDPSLERKSEGRFQTPARPPILPKAAHPLAKEPRVATPPDIFASTHTPGASASALEKNIPWDELRFVGAFQKCFLFFEHEDQLLVVDQHAFHERILYERLLKNPDLLKRTQPLLMPEVLNFSPAECVEFSEKKAEFKKLGFDYDVVSAEEIEVRAVPSLLVNKDIQGTFASLLHGTKDHQEILHDVLASVACHAAVRAGEELPEPELKQLVSEAKTVDFFLNCPHGRRVLRWWKANQVAAWFDRLG